MNIFFLNSGGFIKFFDLKTRSFELKKGLNWKKTKNLSKIYKNDKKNYYSGWHLKIIAISYLSGNPVKTQLHPFKYKTDLWKRQNKSKLYFLLHFNQIKKLWLKQLTSN